MIDTLNGFSSVAERSPAQFDKLFETITAASQPGAVFSTPTTSGEYTVITASEIFAGGGFGFCAGTGPSAAGEKNQEVAGGSGAGGGGGSSGRPVAVISIGPDGVKVRPVLDATKVALAAMGAWASVALVAMRISRAGRGVKS